MNKVRSGAECLWYEEKAQCWGEKWRGTSDSMSAKQGTIIREERWGKATRQAWAQTGQKSSVWEREKVMQQDGKWVGGDQDMRWNV